MSVRLAGGPQVRTFIVALTVASGAIAQPSTPSAKALPAVVEQPRSFGYVVGDLLTQRVLLQAAGSNFEPAALPEIQRVNVWLERRTPRIELAGDGRRWLVLEYQVINAPQAVTTIRLPAWQLESKDASESLAIPGSTITVAPLIPRSSPAGELRPDRAAPTIATAPIRRRLHLWSIALAVTLAAWLAWLQWRRWRDELQQPFARALRELRGLDESTPQAWQVLHRAFDRTAGRVTQTETLPILFQRAPQLQPLRPQIERFFTQSSERFFGAAAPNDLLSVRELCHELRRIEKRYAP